MPPKDMSIELKHAHLPNGTVLILFRTDKRAIVEIRSTIQTISLLLPVSQFYSRDPHKNSETHSNTTSCVEIQRSLPVTRVASKIQMTKSHLSFPHLYGLAPGQGTMNTFRTVYFRTKGNHSTLFNAQSISYESQWFPAIVLHVNCLFQQGESDLTPYRE
jgi:hypothetical protein